MPETIGIAALSLSVQAENLFIFSRLLMACRVLLAVILGVGAIERERIGHSVGEALFFICVSAGYFAPGSWRP